MYILQFLTLIDIFEKQCPGSGYELYLQHFGFIDPYMQKYGDPRIRTQGENNTKISKKKLFALKTQTSTVENFSFVQKKPVSLKEIWIRIEIKRILSTA